MYARISTAAGLRLWRAAQYAGLLLTVALVVALLRYPRVALPALWDVAIPLLPAVFLIQPAIWRNVCPLATLNRLPATRGARHPMTEPMIRVATIASIALLLVLVPARRFLFNMNGVALAAVIVAVAALACVLGFVFAHKAGFCNSLCPVLPVEKLYGQSPLVRVGTAQCDSCNTCTAIGCLELAQTKAVAQALGPTLRSHRWLTTAFGLFACAFPGFVIGYGMTADGPVGTAPAVYATVGAWMLTSVLVTQFVVRGLNLSAETVLPVLGAIALTLYYWFAAATAADHLGLPRSSPIVIRAIALSIVMLWVRQRLGPRWRALRVRPV